MKLTASILSLFAVVTVANAATTTTSDMAQTHEVLVSQTLGSLAFGGGASTGTTSPTQFGLTAGYNYQFMPGFMVGIQPSITYLKQGDAKAMGLGFLAGPTVNFPLSDKFDNAFFLFG